MKSNKNHSVRWSQERWLRRRENLALRYLDMRAHNTMGLSSAWEALRRTELRIGAMWPELTVDFTQQWSDFDNGHRHHGGEAREGCIYCLLDRVRRSPVTALEA